MAVYGIFCKFIERNKKPSWLLSLLVGSLSEDSDLAHAGNPKENGVTTVLLTPASQVGLDYSFFFSYVLRAWVWFLPLLWNYSALIPSPLVALQ